VFAHPDDESLACGGLLARCAALGVRVTLVCATSGEWGSDSAVSIGAERARELQDAARVLGIHEVIMLAREDGMLPWVDPVALEAEIGDAIRSRHPDVVITFAEDGLYWHPDHIAIHERTTAAVSALGGDAPALYYVTMPPGCMREVMDAAEARAGAEMPRRIFGIPDADAFGTLAAAPTLVTDCGEFAVRKLAAIRCHRSQLRDDAFDLLSEDDARRLLAIEHFRRAPVGGQRDVFLEHLTDARSPA
jgi:LmbE family N-acetylglucosaminyl deacetylase